MEDVRSRPTIWLMPLDSLKWAGTGLFAMGATVISIFPQTGLHWWPFGAFLVGHSFWATAGLMAKDKPVIWLNFMYIPFDLYAIIIRAGGLQ